MKPRAWPRAVGVAVAAAVGLGAQPEGAGSAVAPVNVIPKYQILLAGEACVFRTQGAVAGAPGWMWATVEPGAGTVDGAGAYRAPMVAAPALFHVRATRPGPAPAQGEATVAVLPREPFAGVLAFLDGASPPAYSEALPFLDIATGERFGEGCGPRSWAPEASLEPRLVAGYGLPLTLRWTPFPEVAGELLSYLEDGEAVRRDVTGQGSAVVHLRSNVRTVTLEAMVRCGPCPGGWGSWLREQSVGVRGMVPLAGNAVAGPGHRDGAGLAARFQEPYGVAVVGGGHWSSETSVVADRGSHVIRCVTGEGEATTGWGRAGEPGHADGGAQARFRGPTFVAAMGAPACEGPWNRSTAFVVSDTGNHLIRKVGEDGRVVTLAGVPGQAGHQDADDPRQAAFRNPMGLTVDDQGNVYVADAGNHVIRKVARKGEVTTLAGAPGQPGTQDGAGAQARFSDLKGLALCRRETCLYAADGHAIRRVGLDGRVTTVLGQPDLAGFRDLPPGPKDPEAPREPCLRAPCGLVAQAGRLYLADEGNHAVREFDLATGALRTLAGDPAQDTVRWGLLRDGVPGALEEGYAALHAPRGLALGVMGGLRVATGPCLVELLRQHLPDGPQEPPALRVARPRVAVGESFAVEFQVPTRSRKAPDSRPILFRLDFLNEDGSLAARHRGTGAGEATLIREGCLTKPGRGAVLLQAVTDQGVSLGARLPVEAR